jgi:cytidine deaminase
VKPVNAESKHDLIRQAIAASHNAYIPYSHYPVGAALVTADGVVFTGCNVENAAYPATICAERTALVKAISEGERKFAAIAVVTKNGGSPCGTCRQALFEFAPNMLVILADINGQIRAEFRLHELLPAGFGPTSLSSTSLG